MRRETLAYTLGLYLGEYIISEYLPTLSTDDIQTRNVIEVSHYEKVKHRELRDKWFSKTNYMAEKYNKETEKRAWIKLRTFDIKMEDKYLPKELNLILRNFRFSDYSEEEKKDIVDGIIASLWDCDCCTYSLDKNDLIFITCDITNSTELKMKLDINKEIIF